MNIFQFFIFLLVVVSVPANDIRGDADLAKASTEHQDRALHSGHKDHNHNLRYDHSKKSKRDDFDDKVVKAAILYDKNCDKEVRYDLKEFGGWFSIKYFDRRGRKSKKSRKGYGHGDNEWDHGYGHKHPHLRKLAASDSEERQLHESPRNHYHIPGNSYVTTTTTTKATQPRNHGGYHDSDHYHGYGNSDYHQPKQYHPYRLWGSSGDKNQKTLERAIYYCDELSIWDIAMLVSVDNFKKKDEKECKRDCETDHFDDYDLCVRKTCDCLKKCDKKYDLWSNYHRCAKGCVF